MKTMKAKDGRKFNITYMADKVAAGQALSDSCPAEIRAAVTRLVARHAREAREDREEGVTIYGRIVSTTDKALLFNSLDAWNGTTQSLAGEHLLPLSQITVSERAVGAVDAVTVPNWLVKAKS